MFKRYISKCVAALRAGRAQRQVKRPGRKNVSELSATRHAGAKGRGDIAPAHS
jgi:hypothetical protein